MKYFLVASFEWLFSLLFSLPRYRLLNRVKAAALRMMGAKIGSRVVFYPGVRVLTGRNLALGDDVDLAFGVVITTDGGVTIGDRTLVGYGAQILSKNHRIPPTPDRIFDSGHQSSPIVIGSDVWIGANCIILPGVSVGDGAVVAAGAVVTKPIPEYSLAAGIPARVIRKREGVRSGLA